MTEGEARSRGLILWADDDLFLISSLVHCVRDQGFEVLEAHNASEAWMLLEERLGKVDLAILDVMMPHGRAFSARDTKGGYAAGLSLGRRIRRKYPRVPLMALSVVHDPEVERWFAEHGVAYVRKGSVSPHGLLYLIEQVMSKEQQQRRNLKILIVHGHDTGTKYELKNYIQNTIGLGEPIILHELPSMGRTIIEKFEDESADIDLVLVLLTPDDRVSDESDANTEKRRARQNVIFEMGYFFGRLQRREGRIILLYKGRLELPSDISGIVYVDISNGIEAAGEVIRREISRFAQHE